MAAYTWYFTDLSRTDKSSSTWNIDAPSDAKLVWFGTSNPPAGDTNTYELVIIDTNGNGLVDGEELSAALFDADLSGEQTNNAYIGTASVNIDGTTQTTMAFDPVAGGSIQTATQTFAISLEALDTSYNATYKPGSGNFQPFYPGSLSPEKPKPDGVITGTIGNDVIDVGYFDAHYDSVDGNDAIASVGGVGNDDIIEGLAGNDSINGNLGNDTIFGGDGADSILGGVGNDRLYGYGDWENQTLDDGARDLLVGGDGDDRAWGGGGNDTIYGDAQTVGSTLTGADILSGGDGDDLIYGGGGTDSITGGVGADSLYGEAGADTLYDNAGTGNILDGGDGNDLLHAATSTIAGDEGAALFGGAGDDTLLATGTDAGSTTLTGGAGADNFAIQSNIGTAHTITITDFGDSVGSVLGDGIQSNNNFVNLGASKTVIGADGTSYTTGGYYTQANLDAWNAAHPTQTYISPLAWLRADWADDGVLNMAPNLSLTLGGVTSASQLTAETTNVVCFGGGTLIETADGPRPVEALVAGDLVMTRDIGLQPLRWTGARTLSASDLAAAPHLQPIRISAGALGAGRPERDLIVSPQHRILVRSKIALRMFGAMEVLVAAKKLVGLPGIAVATDLTSVRYVHLLFDRHQVVISNGAETESLFTGAEALRSVGPAARDEILTLFPELASPEPREAVRRIVEGKGARHLAERHAGKGRVLVM